MGLPQDEPTVLYVDNSGAVELSRDRKLCHRSRHVDRRYFKVRELSFEGELRVEHVPTKDNSADLLTKVLPYADYCRHRARMMNLSTLPKVPRADYDAAMARKNAGTPRAEDEVILSHAVSRGVE